MISWQMNWLVFHKEAALFTLSKLVYEKSQMSGHTFWKITNKQPDVWMYGKKSGLMFVILKRSAEWFVIFTVYKVSCAKV